MTTRCFYPPIKIKLCIAQMSIPSEKEPFTKKGSFSLFNLQIYGYIWDIYILWGYETSILGTRDSRNHSYDDIYDIGEGIHDDILDSSDAVYDNNSLT